MKEYITIEGFGSASYEIQKSRFLTYTAHAKDENSAREFILSIKKKHFDARHNCSAWVLGIDSSLQKSNDDGEPGGTAGNPILEAIKQKGLTNIVVVVTRYFGGIKLGAGGLIRAYSHSATLGLDASQKVAIRPFVQIDITIQYPILGILESWIRNKAFLTLEPEYASLVKLKILVSPEIVEKTIKEITNITAASATIEIGKSEYHSIKL